MTPAPFIALDGIDGTGKSTQVRLLAEWLRGRGVDVVTCADPGGTPLGDQLRAILLGSKDEIGDRAEALLFLASRAELVRSIIRPALNAGRAVVSDRYETATTVYQGHAGSIPASEVRLTCRLAAGGLRPDRTLILDLPVEAAMRRRGREPDRMESRGIKYAGRVRRGFLDEAKLDPRLVVIDAGGGVDEVQAAIRAAVSPLFEGPR